MLNASQCSPECVSLSRAFDSKWSFVFLCLVFLHPGWSEKATLSKMNRKDRTRMQSKESGIDVFFFSFFWMRPSWFLKIILPSPQASCPGIKDICQPQLGAVKAARQEVRGLLVEGNAAAADPGSVSSRLLLRLLPLASAGRQCSWHSVI